MNPNQQTQNQIGETSLQTVTEQTLDIIRNETAFSKYPIHNIGEKGSKTGINIIKKSPDGNIEFKWQVSYSDRYGQAGQLAYKLDTIVIDRRIEEAGKPLPERICLGSLRQIADELGSGGKNTNKVRLALRQNASAFIIAKLKYKANDGGERTFEADFTRYSIVFTGEKFPDGTKADAVYIILNPIYRDVLNNALTRPLDFAYKKQLTPTAQRFYEIVSYKIYAALTYKLPYAKLPYSEYCMSSAQQRYFDYDHFKKQMYKIHRPHLASHYIKDVHYEQTTDDQGNIDWIMSYTPGRKAIAEYETFTGKRKPRKAQLIDATSQITTAKTVERDPSKPSVHLKHLDTLISYGIVETEAKKLLQSLPENQPVEDQLAYVAYVVSRQRIDNPAGLCIRILRNNDPLPQDFETKSKREARKAREEEERKAKDQRDRQEVFELKTESEYNSCLDSEIDTYIDNSPKARQELIQVFYADNPNSKLPEKTIIATQKRASRSKYSKILDLPTLKQYQEHRKILDIPLTVPSLPSQEQLREIWKHVKAQHVTQQQDTNTNENQPQNQHPTPPNTEHGIASWFGRGLAAFRSRFGRF